MLLRCEPSCSCACASMPSRAVRRPSRARSTVPGTGGVGGEPAAIRKNCSLPSLTNEMSTLNCTVSVSWYPVRIDQTPVDPHHERIESLNHVGLINVKPNQRLFLRACPRAPSPLTILPGHAEVPAFGSRRASPAPAIKVGAKAIEPKRA